jgi:hypothetical protein
MRVRLLYIALPTVLSITLSPRPTPAQQTTPSVVPGVTIHVNSPRTADTVVYRRFITLAGKDSATGTRTVVSRVVQGPNRTSLLEVEQRFPTDDGELVDTAVAELPTLRAVAHRSHQPMRTMRFDFVADAADGTVLDAVPAGLPPRPAKDVHQSLGGPIFDSNIIDLVVASLPLDTGFATTLPFFIYERGGRVPMSVAVRERAHLPFGKAGDRDVWIVTIGVPDAPATVWVDAKTRAVLRMRYDIGARGVSFTDERVTPLRG